MDAGPGLDGEVRIQFSQLGDCIFRLLVVAGPGVGGGEVDIWVHARVAARDRLAAPFDRLLPLREVCVEVAHEELPTANVGITWAQANRGFNSGEAVLAVAEKTCSKSEVRMRVWIVGVVRKRSLSLRYCCFPLLFGEENLCHRHMGPRIVRLKGQGGV